MIKRTLELRMGFLKEKLEFDKKMVEKYYPMEVPIQSTYETKKEIENIEEILQIEDLDKEFEFGKVSIQFAYSNEDGIYMGFYYKGESYNNNATTIPINYELEDFYNRHIILIKDYSSRYCYHTENLKMKLCDPIYPRMVENIIKFFKENKEEITSLFNKFLDIKEYIWERQKK